MTYRDRPGPLAIAHRGGGGLAAENTLEAFRRSYHLGVRFLETDVRQTFDGQLVAFHDARLNRVTEASGPVRHRTLGELTGLQVLGGGPVMALPSLLASFPDACFTLDVKHPAVVAPLADLLTATGLASRVCVAAARGRWVRELRARVGSELCTALSWRERPGHRVDVNDPDTMHRLLDHGVDGIITDRPDLLREVLIARGQWHTPTERERVPS